jgi:two-component system, NtrC family, sensor kinase
LGTSVAGSPRPSEIPANGKGVYQRVSVIDGVPRLYAYNRVAQYPLVVTVGLDLEHGLHGATTQARVLVALATLATLLVGTLVPYLVREIAQRTQRERELQQSKEAADLVARELHEAQSALVTTARQAGMAEIATNVLHNVGNVLTSVNVSAGLVTSTMRDSAAQGLAKAVQLMNEHAADLGDFLTRDAKGQRLLGYLNKLVAALAAEQGRIVDELGSLTKSVEHIKAIVATQQSYAGAASVVEATQIRELVEDALRMHAGALTRQQVTVVKAYADIPVLLLDKPRVLQILVNLIANATQAMDSVRDRAHHLTLRIEVADQAHGRRLRLCVADNGEGITPDHLAQLFVHGFTTRTYGHGFGLHSCALAAAEMGGTLTAQSQGPGHGAAFTLELPIKPLGDLL